MKLVVDIDGIAEELQNDVTVRETERQIQKYEQSRVTGEELAIYPEYWETINEAQRMELRMRAVSLLKYFDVEV